MSGEKRDGVRWFNLFLKRGFELVHDYSGEGEGDKLDCEPVCTADGSIDFSLSHN